MQSKDDEPIVVTPAMWVAGFLAEGKYPDWSMGGRMAGIYAAMERVRRAELDPEVKAHNQREVGGSTIVLPGKVRKSGS